MSPLQAHGSYTKSSHFEFLEFFNFLVFVLSKTFAVKSHHCSPYQLS